MSVMIKKFSSPSKANVKWFPKSTGEKYLNINKHQINDMVRNTGLMLYQAQLFWFCRCEHWGTEGINLLVQLSISRCQSHDLNAGGHTWRSILMATLLHSSSEENCCALYCVSSKYCWSMASDMSLTRCYKYQAKWIKTSGITKKIVKNSFFKIEFSWMEELNINVGLLSIKLTNSNQFK